MNKRNRVQKSFKGVVSLTKQAPAGMMTPAQIMRRFSAAGIDPMNEYYKKQFGDASKASDLFSATLLVQEASTAFQSLPSAVRERFKNDPVKLLDFLGDEKNLDEAVKLGLCEARKELPTVSKGTEAHSEAEVPQPSVVETVDNSNA